RYTVGGGSVAGWEALSWNDKGSSVGAKVEEELAQNVKGEKAAFRDFVEGTTNDEEEDSENGETHELNRLATDSIDGGDSDPITRNGAGADEDDVSDSVVTKSFVNIGMFRVTDLLE